MVCIYCRHRSGPEQSVEHIVPESLGCHPDLVLHEGEVCGDCNHRLGRADQHLVELFRIFNAIACRPSKAGKHVAFECADFKVVGTESGPEVTYRELTGNSAVVPESKTSGHPTSEWVDHGDGTFHFSFGAELRIHAGVARALYKIAFEFAALVEGREYVLAKRFDKLRFWIAGRGNRKVEPRRVAVLVRKEYPTWPKPEVKVEWHQVGRWKRASGEVLPFPSVGISIHGITFCCPLTEKGDWFLDQIRESIDTGELQSEGLVLMFPDHQGRVRHVVG